jgi:hypothetical protein
MPTLQASRLRKNPALRLLLGAAAAHPRDTEAVSNPALADAVVRFVPHRRFPHPARILVLLVAAWISFRAGIPPASAQIGDIAVVVNIHNSTDNLSSADLRKIFAGEKRSWPGGLAIKLFVRAAGARERIALLKLLKMSESEYKQYWTAKVFRVEAQAEPIALFSNGMQKEAIELYPGGISLVNIQDVKSSMKIVRIEGRKPGEPGYSLD